MKRSSSQILIAFNFLAKSNTSTYTSAFPSTRYFTNNSRKVPQLQRRVQAFSRSVVESMAYPLKSTSSNANLLPIPTWFNSERLRILSERDDVETGDNKHKCIVYWMQRDMRVEDNWAIAYAQYLSKEHNLPLRVIYAFNRVQW